MINPKNNVSSFLLLAATSLILSGCSLTSSPSTPSATLPTAAPTMMPSESTKKGKTSSAIQDYQTPAGTEQVGFNLSVDDKGIISTANVDILGKAPISKMRQEAFAKEFTAAVVGKKLSDLKSIDRLGGSSLTTKAFNTALGKLQSQLM